MFIFSRYQLELYPDNYMSKYINRGSTLRIFLDGKHIQVKVINVQKSYISFYNLETAQSHTMDMKEFLDLYINYMNLDMDKDSILFRNIYSLSEHGKAYDIGDEFKLSAPLLDLYQKHVRLNEICITLPTATIILVDMDTNPCYRKEFKVQEPISISRLPEPHTDIINLPQYYIEPM